MSQAFRPKVMRLTPAIFRRFRQRLQRTARRQRVKYCHRKWEKRSGNQCQCPSNPIQEPESARRIRTSKVPSKRTLADRKWRRSDILLWRHSWKLVFTQIKKHPAARPGVLGNRTEPNGRDQAKMSVTGMPLSPTVNGRLEGDMTTSSTGSPMAWPMVARKSCGLVCLSAGRRPSLSVEP